MSKNIHQENTSENDVLSTKMNEINKVYRELMSFLMYCYFFPVFLLIIYSISLDENFTVESAFFIFFNFYFLVYLITRYLVIQKIKESYLSVVKISIAENKENTLKTSVSITKYDLLEKYDL